MAKTRHDGIYLLQGITVTCAFTGAIFTLGGLCLSILLLLAPSEIESTLRQFWGRSIEANLMVAALIQAVVWAWLPRIRFVSWRLGRVMMTIMGCVTLAMVIKTIFSS
ncbi:MAG: hypothetical protein HC769_12770 [Cyanobacteria bacterium CRU_2_1]|nr:hypothetical protein [Cyanobacteria bacterium RU_5_0]NJR59632.1 hypothetical protein [Cyanobacteria bacterium CRU_2_1]